MQQKELLDKSIMPDEEYEKFREEVKKSRCKSCLYHRHCKGLDVGGKCKQYKKIPQTEVIMSKIWLTSDWHFGHNREFIWKARGFSSVEEMNEYIINTHNSLVQPEDDVYVLGDLMLGNSSINIEYIKRLNGKLHIVRGNHDTDTRWEMYSQLPNVVEQSNAITFKYKQHHFYLSHYPTLTGNLEKENLTQMTLNLYGHTHQKEHFYLDMPFMYNVGVDAHNCFPIDLDTIIAEMYKKVEECKSFLDN